MLPYDQDSMRDAGRQLYEKVKKPLKDLADKLKQDLREASGAPSPRQVALTMAVAAKEPPDRTVDRARAYMAFLTEEEAKEEPKP